MDQSKVKHHLMMKMTETTNSPIMNWIRDHLEYPYDYCLIWPFGKRAGYGFLMREGKGLSAHRYICELIHGPAPLGHVAAHSCGRGHDACVNPRHLSWKTISENQLDRVDGKGNRKRSKLTAAQAAQIRAVATLEPIRVTAERYGVSESAIRQVQSGKTWGGGDRRRRLDLTTDQVLYIRRMKGVVKPRALAAEMNLPDMVIYRVMNRKAYGYVTDETSQASC